MTVCSCGHAYDNHSALCEDPDCDGGNPCDPLTIWDATCPDCGHDGDIHEGGCSECFGCVGFEDAPEGDTP